MTVQGTTVTSTVLVATVFFAFCVRFMDVPPPNLQKYVTAAFHPSPYVTDLAAATEAS